MIFNDLKAYVFGHREKVQHRSRLFDWVCEAQACHWLKNVPCA
jgi:hypothetical protein